MTGGVGFTKDGIESSRANRSLLKKKAPFQRLKENLFGRKSPKLKMDIDESFLNDLHQIQKDRREEDRIRRRFLAFFVIVLLFFIFS